jgi:pimeloyl-ACP methyl ester carboxylesterase
MNRADSIEPQSPRNLRLWHSVLGPADAPPVLVVHGITGSHRYWTPRIAPLARTHRLLLPDLPGFGQSPKPFADYTMEYFVEAVLGFLQQHGCEKKPLQIVGHSLGALIALELASHGEISVRRLALLNMPRFLDPTSAHRIMLDGSASYRRLLTVDSLAANWSQLRRNGWRLTARSLRRLPWSVVADARKFTFRSLTSTLEHCLLHYSPDRKIESLPPGIDTLLIHGDRDQVAPLATIRELATRPPYPHLHVIQGAGHNLFHTHGQECLRVTAAFLDGRLARRAPPA